MQQIGLDAVLNNVPDFTGGIDKMNRAVDSFAKNSKGAGGDFAGGFGEIVTGALRHIGTLAVDSLLKAGQAIAGFVKDSIGLAGNFEAGMLNFQAVAGQEVDAKGLEEFRDLFIDIGKRLPVSTGDVQAAAIEMVKGGIDPAIIAAGGLERNIQFAAAAMEGDLVKAAEISSKILGGWSDANATATEKTDFLARATDLLTKAANASATDVEGLSRGIFQAQGIAKTAGVSFDDLTTTLALLAPRFASSAEAGTSVKNMIARLQPTTDPATVAMMKLGLYTEETGSAFYDAAGNFVGFETASQLLQTSLQGLTKEQQAAALQTIFGNDAMGAAAALADGGALAYQNMAQALLTANGVSENAALKQQGFDTALENTKGSIEALQITIGSALLPILESLLNEYISPAINALTDLASAVFGDTDAFQKLSPAMQEIVTIIDTVVMDVQNIIGAFNDAGASSVEFAMTIGELVQDLGGPGDLITDIVFAIQDLVSWFSQASSETSALDSVLVDLADTWDNVLYAVENVMAGYMAIVQAVLPIVTRFVDEHGTEIAAFFKSTWESIVQIVNLALILYSTIVPPILTAIAGFISDHGSEITKILSGVWEVISSLITGVLETIKGVLSLALNVMRGDWSAAWEDVKNIGKAQWDAITGILTGALDAIAGLFDTSLAEIGQTWADNWNAMVDLINEVGWVEAGNLIVAGIKQGIADGWDSLMGWFSDKVAGLVDAAMEAIGAASPAKEFMPVGEFATMGIMQGFADTWPQLTALVGDLSDDLIGQVEDLGREIQSAIADSFGATASIDRQVAANLDKMKDVLPQNQIHYQDQLNRAQKEAEKFADPSEGAKYFQMRSKQILETAKLEKEASEAATSADRARIEAKLLLINRAHRAELNQFDANRAAQSTPYQDIIEQLNALMAAGLPINDTGPGHDMMILLNHLMQLLNAPHRAGGGPVATGMPYWVGEQGPELFYPKMAGDIVSQPNMRAPASGGNSTSYNRAQTINMPIYTNMSPSAIQSSLAIASAALL